MAINQTTSLVVFDTRTTDLATNTTLGTATRHDFTAKTLYVPETTSRTWRSVIARGSLVLQGNATGLDLDGIRAGIKIGAVAFSDLDMTFTIANSGEQWHVEWASEVTSYFTTNDPGTASFSVQVGIAVATGAASNVTMCTAHVEAAYDFDDAAATLVSVAMIPLQSHHGLIGSAYTEVGTTGGTTNAPVNQIPQLTGAGGFFDGITGFVLRSSHLRVIGCTTPQSTATFAPSYRFDGAGTTFTRATLDPAAATSLIYYDDFDLGAGGANLSTTAAHAFEFHPGNNNNFERVGAILIVVYEYTANSTTQVVSVRAPLRNIEGEQSILASPGTVSADADRYSAEIDVQEPGTITILQSGVLLYSFTGGNSTAQNVGATGQIERPYTHANVTRDACSVIVHRCDHSSSTWALARGANRLSVNWFTGSNAAAYPVFGYALINYRCGAAGARRLRTVCKMVVTHEDTSSRAFIQTPTAMVLPSGYKIAAVGCLINPYVQSASGSSVAAERAATERAGDGWWRSAGHHATSSMSELGSSPTFVSTRWIRERAAHQNGALVSTSRRWLIHNANSCHGFAELWITYHNHTFTVSGTVTIDGSPAPDGGSFAVWAFDSEDVAEKVDANVLSNGNGTFSVQVPDNTRTYLVTFTDGVVAGSSLVGTPGTSTFNIAINTGGGGSGVPLARVANGA